MKSRPVDDLTGFRMHDTLSCRHQLSKQVPNLPGAASSSSCMLMIVRFFTRPADQIVFLAQGRGEEFPPTMTLVNPYPPYNSTGKPELPQITHITWICIV